MLTSDEIRQMYFENEKKKLTPPQEEQWLKVIQSPEGFLFCFWDEAKQKAQWCFRKREYTSTNWIVRTPHQPWATTLIKEPTVYSVFHADYYINPKYREPAESDVRKYAKSLGLVTTPATTPEIPVEEKKEEKPAYTLTITVTGEQCDRVFFMAKQLLETIDKNQSLESINLQGTNTKGTCVLERVNP